MEVRLAEKSDLKNLDEMFGKIIDLMEKKGVFLWNKYYPFEEFENDIKNKNLFLLCDGKTILSCFAIIENKDEYDCFLWKDKNAKAVYLCRLGVNADFSRQGIGSKTIEKIKEICKSKNAKFLRLTVATQNVPAIKFYTKNGFKQVEGKFEGFSEANNKNIIELGFEIKI